MMLLVVVVVTTIAVNDGGGDGDNNEMRKMGVVTVTIALIAMMYNINKDEQINFIK